MIKKAVILTLLALSFSILLFSCAEYDADIINGGGSSPVAYVNGETITKNELEYFKNRLRADVMNSYISEFSCEYSEGFWTMDFNGTTPGQELFELSLEECVKAKIQLVLCREHGIYSDISYEALYKKAVVYNDENSQKANAVGIKSIGLSQFYSYYLNNGVLLLKNRLAGDELKPTDDEIERQLEGLSGNLKSGRSEDELYNAAKKLAVDRKYDDYITSLCKAAQVEKF